MVKSFLFSFISLLCTTFTTYVFGQNLQVIYELAYKTDSMQKKQTYLLDISDQTSIFRTQMRRSSDSMISRAAFGLGYNVNPDHELYFTKERTHSIYKKYFMLAMSRDRFFIKIDDELKWKILPEISVIANLKCQKAEVAYGGRHWSAWFTKDIAISEGPYYFHGLPGLIIQLQDEDSNFFFNAVEIKRMSYDFVLYENTTGNEITWEQYQKLMLGYFQNPYAAVQTQGMKVVTDNGNGGYKEIDYRARIKGTQRMLLKNNNPIELDHKVEYK